MPALLAWGACWIVFFGLRLATAPLAAAALVATVLGVLLALLGTTPWRRVFVGAGFPFSLLASGAAGGLPAWSWLAPLGLLALLYPLRAWRDAPLFPTPAGALAGLARQAPLGRGAAILDAGCGLGAGLLELQREYPDAALTGIEWSLPLRVACSWRCRFARIRRDDIWRVDWAPFALVYLFQRPESMAAAVDKAARELAPGAWLASLEFEASTLVPEHVLRNGDGRPVWLYGTPFVRR